MTASKPASACHAPTVHDSPGNDDADRQNASRPLDAGLETRFLVSVFAELTGQRRGRNSPHSDSSHKCGGDSSNANCLKRMNTLPSSGSTVTSR